MTFLILEEASLGGEDSISINMYKPTSQYWPEIKVTFTRGSLSVSKDEILVLSVSHSCWEALYWLLQDSWAQ